MSLRIYTLWMFETHLTPCCVRRLDAGKCTVKPQILNKTLLSKCLITPFDRFFCFSTSMSHKIHVLQQYYYYCNIFTYIWLIFNQM